jgi:hypothetical protein
MNRSTRGQTRMVEPKAPVAQWIGQRFPKPRAHVRFMPGALATSRASCWSGHHQRRPPRAVHAFSRAGRGAGGGSRLYRPRSGDPRRLLNVSLHRTGLTTAPGRAAAAPKHGVLRGSIPNTGPAEGGSRAKVGRPEGRIWRLRWCPRSSDATDRASFDNPHVGT